MSHLRKQLSNLIEENEEIVISGVGGRYPMSGNFDEFATNLFDNIDMVTEDEDGERWPKSKLKELTLFK